MRKKQHADNKEEKPDMMIRAATMIVARAEGEDGKTSVRMSVSSEEPVLTVIDFNGQWQRAYEILDHSEGSVDLSRCSTGLVILDRHYGDQVGLIASPALYNRKLGGDVSFCSGPRAKEIEQDALNGLRTNVSVGYAVDSSSYRLEGDKDGIPVVRAMRWTPYEGSFEPVPADPGVGVGRSVNVVTSKKSEPKEKVPMSDEKKEQRKLTADEVVSIYQLARTHQMEPGVADDHIKRDGSLDEFRAMALSHVEKREKSRAEDEAKRAKEAKPDRPANLTPEPVFDRGEKREIQKRYNLVNVIRSLSGIKADIGFERELSDELTKRTGRSPQGIMVPHEAYTIGRSTRDFVKTSNGSNMVATDLMADQFIDALRSRMVLQTAGATIMSGLVGDVAIPKQSATATGYWIDGETGTNTESNPTISQVTGTPHTAGGYTDISRRLLIQSSVDAQQFVQNDLLAVIARKVETAAFSGSGSNGEPTGLTGASGLNSPTITQDAVTWAQVLDFIGYIEADNAAFDGQSWIMPAAVMTHLAARPRFVSTSSPEAAFGPFILDMESRTCAGYPYQVTTNVSAGTLWFGAWAQLVIGLWSGIDITVDPYSNSTIGAVRIVALQDADVMVRNGQAFSYQSALLS